AFARRRAILPAEGYYEWHDKQPYFIRPADGSVMAMAGLYEYWRDAEAPKDDPDSWMWTAVVLTTQATDNLGHLHDRAPLIVPRDEYDTWLSPEVSDPEELRGLLLPATVDAIADQVSKDVNNVRHNGPELIEPVG
nr:SOS response-associated peptidase [Longispora sp. (in: high G+C Gram-positive bacteria)]